MPVLDLSYGDALAAARAEHDLTLYEQASEQGRWTVTHEWWGPQCADHDEDGWYDLTDAEREAVYAKEFARRRRASEAAFGKLVYHVWEHRDGGPDEFSAWDAVEWTVYQRYQRPRTRSM